MLKNHISLTEMILFSPAKINIGLQITERRKDGFHNLQSVMFPVGLCDILEIRISDEQEEGIRLDQSGIRLESGSVKNLCIEAFELLSKETSLPSVHVHVHKQIPVGAGLGGGSSNAASALRGLNSLSAEPVSEGKLHELATQLGSDCPFFLYNQPMMMEGRGEILRPVPLQLDQVFLVLLFPRIHVSTAEAYGEVIPMVPGKHLKELIAEPLSKWKHLITNDFEKSVFKKHPVLGTLKEALYDAGSLYASMSGSGSSLYGIFPEKPSLPESIEQFVIWKGPLSGPQHGA